MGAFTLAGNHSLNQKSALENPLKVSAIFSNKPLVLDFNIEVKMFTFRLVYPFYKKQSDREHYFFFILTKFAL